jgi:menaquinone-dependent protoporphyrinogen oxidase
MSTLIVYGTKHGTTGRCASILAKKLTGEVTLHDLKDGEVTNLDKYDRIIVGGSIYAGRVLKAVSTFCARNKDVLKGRKLGLYICCLFRDNAETQLRGAFPEELLDFASASENFGGEAMFSDMNFAERLITKMVSKSLTGRGDGSTPVDTKKDMSMLIEENIVNFAREMNMA